jgi:hypothetical protein
MNFQTLFTSEEELNAKNAISAWRNGKPVQALNNGINIQQDMWANCTK